MFVGASSCTRSNVPKRTITSTGNSPAVDNDHVVVRELTLDPDEYEIFQRDPCLFLGLDKNDDDGVELDIEVIDKREKLLDGLAVGVAVRQCDEPIC